MTEFCLAQQKTHSLANKLMIEAIRTNPAVKGYCVHALTGGDWVLGAGMLDLWREPKETYYGTKEANAARYLALRVVPRNIYAEKGAYTAKVSLTDAAGTLIAKNSVSFDVFNSADLEVPTAQIAVLDPELLMQQKQLN